MPVILMFYWKVLHRYNCQYLGLLSMQVLLHPVLYQWCQLPRPNLTLLLTPTFVVFSLFACSSRSCKAASMLGSVSRGMEEVEERRPMALGSGGRRYIFSRCKNTCIITSKICHNYSQFPKASMHFQRNDHYSFIYHVFGVCK